MKSKRLNHKVPHHNKTNNNNNNKVLHTHHSIRFKSLIDSKIKTIHLQTLNQIMMTLTLIIKINHQINTLVIIKIHHQTLPNLKMTLFNHQKDNIFTLSKKTLIKKMKKVSITSNKESKNYKKISNKDLININSNKNNNHQKLLQYLQM